MSESGPEIGPTPTITPATIEDLPEVVGFLDPLYADAFAGTYDDGVGIPREIFIDDETSREELEKQLTDPAKRLYMAKEADRIVGTVGITLNPSAEGGPITVWLWGFYVAPDQIGGGLADKLFDPALKYAKDTWEADVVTLGVSTRAERAQAYYRKKGFVNQKDANGNDVVQDWDWPKLPEGKSPLRFLIMEQRLR